MTQCHLTLHVTFRSRVPSRDLKLRDTSLPTIAGIYSQPLVSSVVCLINLFTILLHYPHVSLILYLIRYKPRLNAKSP